MNFLYLLDLLGTAAFAASGAWAGIRRKMDLFGVLVMGLVTATGGGTLRDLLLGDTPFVFQDEMYLYLATIVSLTVFFFHRKIGFLHNPLFYFDAVGLGTFVVIGTGKAIAFNMGFGGSVILGVMTATAGGIIRDVLANEVPLILRREIYASACLAGATLLYLLHRSGFPENWAFLAAALTVIVLRLLAIQYNWSLPRAQT